MNECTQMKCTYETSVFLLNSGFSRVDHSKVVILANVPVSQTFVLHFSVFSVRWVGTLSVVYDELLVDVEELGAWQRKCWTFLQALTLFNFTNQVFDMQLCLPQDWCTRQRKLSVCSCSESSRHLLNLSDSSFQMGSLLQFKFSKLKQQRKKYLQKRVMYSLLSSIFPQMLAIVGKLLEFLVKQPAELDKFLFEWAFKHFLFTYTQFSREHSMFESTIVCNGSNHCSKKFK